MKKKLSLRVILILLCAAMLCSIPAHAVEPYASERIDLSMSTLDKNDAGEFAAYFMVQANDVMDVIGATSVEIQRHTFTGWVREYTFTSDKYPELLATNKPRHSAFLRYTPLFPGKTYRSVANIYVENAAGTSKQSLASKSIS